MEKIQEKVQRAGLIILVILCLLCVYIMKQEGKEINSDENYCTLSEHWTLTMGDAYGEDVNLDTLRFDGTQKGDYVKIETVLPAQVVENPVLRLYTIHSEVSVSVDGEEIYHYGKEYRENNELLGYGYHYIDMPEDYMGRTLTIELWVTEDNAFTSFNTPQICNESVMLRDYIISNKLPLAINLFLILFGVCLLTVSLIFVRKNHQFRRLLCIAGFSIGIGCWSLCSYDLVMLFTYNLRVKVFMEFTSLYMSPLFVILYFWEDIASRETIFKVLYFTALGLQCLFLVVTFFLQITQIAHLPAMLRYCHVILALTIIAVLGVALYDFHRHKIRNKALMFGIGVMILVAMADIIRFNVQKYWGAGDGARFSSNLCVGTLLFVLSMIFDFCMEISQTLYESAKQEARQETLEKMAYTDELTGIYNRRRCEEEYDRLDRANSYAMIVFDLNNLKKTNDSKGHDVGDVLIRCFADCLQKAFGRCGVVGRTGGDEFVVILSDMEKAQIEALLADYEKEVMKCNLEHPDLNLSAAYGFFMKRENVALDARGVYREADARMYERKKQMKAGRRD